MPPHPYMLKLLIENFCYGEEEDGKKKMGKRESERNGEIRNPIMVQCGVEVVVLFR